VLTVRRVAGSMLAVFALSACSAGPSGPSGPSDSGITTKAPGDILTQVRANSTGQTSVHIRGKGSCPSGPFQVDMKLRSDDQATGVVVVNQEELRVTADKGNVYVLATPSFWASEVSAAQAAKIGTHWVKIPRESNPCLSALTKFSNVLANYLNYPGDPKKGSGNAVFGVPAVMLMLPPDVAIWVQTHGPVLPVRVDEPTSQTAISLGEWGTPVTVTLPDQTDTVNASVVAGATAVK